MIESVFKSVLIMSASSAVLTLILLIIKPFTEKTFGYRWQYAVWYVVLFCALIPISITLPNSDAIHNTETFKIIETTHLSPQNVTLSAKTQSFNSGLDYTASFVSALSYIWIIGAVYFFAISLIRYLLFLKEINKNSISDGEYNGIKVFSTKILSAPLAVGFFKKKIFIPCYTENEEKHHILLHEYTHIRHHDIFYKWLCLFARCIHWFNPFMYMVSRQIDQQCEIWCDTSVTKDMTALEKKQYMNIILSLISRSNMPLELTTRMADSKHSIKKRFSAITSGTKQSKLIKYLSSCITAVLLASMLFVSGIAGGMAYKNNPVCFKLDFSPKINGGSEKVITDKEETKDFNEEVLQNFEEKIIDKGETQNPSSYYDNDTILETPEEVQAPDRETEDTREDFWVYETDHSLDISYPIFGEMYSQKKDMETVISEIERNGDFKSDGIGTDLSSSYYKDTLSYESGNAGKLKGVKANKNGMIYFFMDSDYRQYITIGVEHNGRQISGNSIIPENDTVYAIGGLDPEKTYDITVTNGSGDTWKTTGEYVIY